MIPISECKPWHLYRGRGRNIGLSVCAGYYTTCAFVGVRHKFDAVYLDTEYHYEQGAPYGTYRPNEDLGPISTEAQALFERHAKAESYTKHTAWVEAWKAISLPDDYVERERVKKALPEYEEYRRQRRIENRLHGRLLTWFKQMEKKHSAPPA